MSKAPVRVQPVPGKGRGVVANRTIPVGEVIERAHGITIPKSAAKGTPIQDHVFDLGDEKHEVVVCGLTSFLNHSDAPNADWDFDDDGVCMLVATREIAEGDEVCINYGTDLWFTPAGPLLQASRQ